MSGPTSLADRIVEAVADLVASATGEACPAVFVRTLERLVEAEVTADARRTVELIEALDEGPERIASVPPSPAVVAVLSDTAKAVLADAAAHDHALDLAEDDEDDEEPQGVEVELLPEPASNRGRLASLTADEMLAAAAGARGWRSLSAALGYRTKSMGPKVAERARELGVAAEIEARPGWGKPGAPARTGAGTTGPVAAALVANGHGNVFGCTSCEFIAGRMDELGRHTIARHGRQIATVERLPLDADEIAERAS